MAPVSSKSPWKTPQAKDWIHLSCIRILHPRASGHKRNFVVKWEGDSLVWNQYIRKPKEKKVGDMSYYIPTVWKSGGDASPGSPT